MSCDRWPTGCLRLVVAVAIWAAVAGAAGPVLASTAPESSGGARVLFRLQEPQLTESSGLAVSRRHRGIVWTHNDGGDVAQVFALDYRGRTKAVVTLRGIDPFDPEALAPGKAARGEPALFLGDIGDNRAARRDISVFRFREPRRMRSQVVVPEWFRLRYPDGAQDAEAMLVDPRDNRLWIVTKDFLGGGLYRAPARLSTSRPNALERVGNAPALVTDGAFLPDGRFVLRDYLTVFVYRRPGRLEAEQPLPVQRQGESIAADGNRLLVGSEGAGSAVHVLPVPRATSAGRASPARSSSPSHEASSSTSSSTGWDRAVGKPGVIRMIVIGMAVIGSAIISRMLVAAFLRRRREAPR